MAGVEHEDAATWSVRRRRGVLEVLYGTEASNPQYAALHLHSSYFRLTPGPAAAWGTSVVLAPVLWRRGAAGPDQGASIREWATETIGQDFHLSFQVKVATIRAQLRLRIPPPGSTFVQTWVEVEIEGEVDLETSRPWDMCKPLMLSSMHVAPDRWDGQAAWAGEQRAPIPVEGWIFPSPCWSHAFGLEGGLSRWQRQRKVGPSPKVIVTLDGWRQVTGWVTPHKTVQDDNVALWPICEELPRSWRYHILAAVDPNPEASVSTPP